MVRNQSFVAVVSRAMILARVARPVSLRMRLRARLIRLAMLLSVAALAAASLAACNAAGTAVVPITGPLVTVQLRGGLCADGPCDSMIVLEHDGRVHDGATPPQNLGLVPAAQMDPLSAAINAADFVTLKSKPFTGECPVNVDGQEQIFTFATAATTETIASCTVEIDWGHPLFIALANALGQWIQIPLM